MNEQPKNEQTQPEENEQPNNEQTQPEENEQTHPEENEQPKNEQTQPEEMTAQLALMEDKFLRTSAELENVRKRSARDVNNARKYALERCLTELTPVLDSLQQAIQSVEPVVDHDAKQTSEEQTNPGQGIENCYKLFLSTLQKFGIKQLNPQGEAFNPKEHEAIAMIPKPNTAPGIVLEVFQYGYMLNDRLVRAAKVVVSQVAETPPPEGAATEPTEAPDPTPTNKHSTNAKQNT